MIAVMLGTLAGLAASEAAAKPLGEISGIHGKVLLSTKHGFVPATLHQPVSAGTRILVGKDAMAVLAFPGCTLTLAPGKIHSIAADPCTSAMNENLPQIRPTADVTGQDGMGGPPPPPLAPIVSDGAILTTVGSVVGVGLGFMVVKALDDKPVSGP